MAVRPARSHQLERRLSARAAIAARADYERAEIIRGDAWLDTVGRSGFSSPI
jgi:hypothetical protein